MSVFHLGPEAPAGGKLLGGACKRDRVGGSGEEVSWASGRQARRVLSSRERWEGSPDQSEGLGTVHSYGMGTRLEGLPSATSRGGTLSLLHG